MSDTLHASVVAALRDWPAPDADQDTLRHAVAAFVAARPDACLRACEPGHITASALAIGPASMPPNVCNATARAAATAVPRTDTVANLT